MSGPSDSSIGKLALRQKMTERRDQLADERRVSAAHSVAEVGLEMIEQLGARTVGGYHPIASELDVLPLLSDLHGAGIDLALPVTPAERAPLKFRRWIPTDNMLRGRFGIMEPLEEHLEVVPDAILVPMLAFNRAGHRLGYGGGYYDMTLRSLRARAKVIAIGVAFDEQETDALDDEDHDEALDWLLTPSKARRVGD